MFLGIDGKLGRQRHELAPRAVFPVFTDFLFGYHAALSHAFTRCIPFATVS